MMLRAVILVAVFGLAMPAWADPAGLTQRRTDLEIESDRLGETRRLIVQVPSSYAAEPGRTYPVFVLTDAIWQFDLVAATLDYHARWGRIPEHLVVGLYNPERNLDLVPAADAGYPGTGGGDAYLAHVTAEVLPLIEARYRTNGVELLFGHSFGGVMTLNQLLTAPEAFDAYIALGASTWVAERILFDRLDEAAMTPMAAKPGISRTVCNQPMSEPSKEAASMTKLFSSAFQVAKLSGMPAARQDYDARPQNPRARGPPGQGRAKCPQMLQEWD